MLNAEYIITAQIPTADEFLAIRSAVGWKNPSVNAAESAMNGSLFCVCVRLHNTMVAFGRVIGDGSFNFYIQDVIVHPDHQGNGLGKAVMSRIMSYIEAAGGEEACIGLMAAKGAVGFYEQFGFSTRPDDAPGMQKEPSFHHCLAREHKP